MNAKLFPQLSDNIDILSERQFARLQNEIADQFFSIGDNSFRWEQTKERLDELYLLVEEFANIFTQGDQFVALIDLAHRALAYYRECERVANAITESKPEIPKIRQYWSGESYDLGVARTVRETVFSRSRFDSEDLTWLCPFSDELAQLVKLRQALRAQTKDTISSQVAFGLPEAVSKANDAWTRQDPAMRKADVQRAYSTLSDAHHELGREIYKLDDVYASTFRRFVTLRQAENALPHAEAGLSKPLEDYAWDWRKHQYNHAGAQIVNELRVKVETNASARSPQSVREINYTITPEHIEGLIEDAVNAHGIYANMLANARTIVTHEQAKEAELAATRTQRQAKRDKKRKEKAQEPVVVPATETAEGIKIDPVLMRRELQKRSGYVVILGTAVAVNLIKNWLAELERNASGKLARDWGKMADGYQVWFSGTGVTNEPITAVASIKSDSYGAMKVKATFKPQAVPADELEFVNVVQFEGVDR